MTPLHEDFTEFVDTLRKMAQQLIAAVKAVWSAIKRTIRPVRKHRAPSAPWRSQALVRKVTPATYIPVRRHPHRKQDR